MDVYCTNTAVWAVWGGQDGDFDDTRIQHLTYDGWVCAVDLGYLFKKCSYATNS